VEVIRELVRGGFRSGGELRLHEGINGFDELVMAVLALVLLFLDFVIELSALLALPQDMVEIVAFGVVFAFMLITEAQSGFGSIEGVASTARSAAACVVALNHAFLSVLEAKEGLTERQSVGSGFTACVVSAHVPVERFLSISLSFSCFFHSLISCFKNISTCLTRYMKD
jgi:hypothetical protein